MVNMDTWKITMAQWIEKHPESPAGKAALLLAGFISRMDAFPWKITNPYEAVSLMIIGRIMNRNMTFKEAGESILREATIERLKGK